MRKVFKYGVFSGMYFLIFGLNTGNNGAERTPYLNTFRAVLDRRVFLGLKQIIEESN